MSDDCCYGGVNKKETQITLLNLLIRFFLLHRHTCVVTRFYLWGIGRKGKRQSIRKSNFPPFRKPGAKQFSKFVEGCCRQLLALK